MLAPILRTIVVYFIVLLALRLMGKRELAQLSPFDFVVAIIIAELAALPMEENNIPLKDVFVPLGVLVILEIGLSYIALKSERARRWIYGTPTVVIARGRILDTNMRRLRYNINDLLAQLRDKGIFDVGIVEYAIVEISGNLSVVLNAQHRPVEPDDLQLIPPREELPVPIIIDGKVVEQNIKYLGYSTERLKKVLEKHSVHLEEVFLATYTKQNGLNINGLKGEKIPEESNHMEH